MWCKLSWLYKPSPVASSSSKYGGRSWEKASCRVKWSLCPAVDVARHVNGRRLGERQVEDLGELVHGLSHVRHDDPDVEDPDVTYCGMASISVVLVVALPSPSARRRWLEEARRLLPSGSAEVQDSPVPPRLIPAAMFCVGPWKLAPRASRACGVSLLDVVHLEGDVARAETPVLRCARHAGWALVLDEFDEMPRPVRLPTRQGQLGDVQAHVFVADEPRRVLVLLSLTVSQAETDAFRVKGDGFVHVADDHSHVPRGRGVRGSWHRSTGAP